MVDPPLGFGRRQLVRDLEDLKPSSSMSAKKVPFFDRDLQVSGVTFVMCASPRQASVEGAVLVSSDANVEVDLRRSVCGRKLRADFDDTP